MNRFTDTIKAVLLCSAALLFHMSAVARVNGNPPPDILNTLQALDRMGVSGKWQQYDSASKAQIQYAIRVCTEYIDEKHDSLTQSMFLYHRGRLHYFMGMNDTALKDLEHSMNINIANVPALLLIEDLTGKHVKGYPKLWSYTSECMDNWRKRCTLDSSNAYNWYNLYKCYELQGRVFEGTYNLNEINKCLQFCILIDPVNAMYYYDLSKYTKGILKIQYLQKAIGLEENMAYRFGLLQAYKLNGKWKEIVSETDRCIQLYPENTYENIRFLADVYAFRSVAFLRLHNEAAAKKSALKSQALKKQIEGIQ